MDLKQSAKETAKVLTSYLTFQAVKTVLNQLKETNPARAYWLNGFSTKEALQDGEAYLSALLSESPDLAIRVMTVRQHIAEGICEFLPEMVVTSIQQANMEHRRQHLERITQLGDAEHTVDSEFVEDADVPQESAADADPSPE
ncbi:MAG TPA: chaperonin family protein RbcX [Nodosilinea sp.]|uniref:RuBisCO chaperone RbcX n=1 Tax=Nodosilinea sp. GSE-PSE-MK55-09B TaxID=2057749 RepID=A0A2R4QLS1_9CYAN|nr:chaperonin family protein RbcX [Leptolyngbya sp. CCNP1308]AVY53720.1 chaperonin-like protein component RbcX [Nodosilinea sp. GSE-PSE-MK55-09B]MEA5447277.1 chaperonin family protein RbcX [Leptolyngbya sp. CCNP1308]HSM80080.1 chaperonin family protein RbcX [Nodosilinea sp.]